MEKRNNLSKASCQNGEYISTYILRMYQLHNKSFFALNKFVNRALLLSSPSTKEGHMICIYMYMLCAKYMQLNEMPQSDKYCGI